MAEKAKAIVLFSGGLDSRLAVKILEEQKINIIPLMFKLPFICCNFSNSDFKSIVNIDCTKGKFFREYIEFIKNPKYGRGSGINPCIDCKIFMFKKAKEYADRQKPKIKIIATGEVLGERPMSQTSNAFKLIDKEIGFEILRPLSAKLLPETAVEKENLVDRSKFFAIQGRSRKIQLELAKKFNIKFPTPAGGCLLCEKMFAKKLQDLFENEKSISSAQIESLNGFRHFRAKGKIILGRNEKENLQLEKLNKKLGWQILIPQEPPGPTVIFKSKEDKNLAEDLIKAYSNRDLKKREKLVSEFGI